VYVAEGIFAVGVEGTGGVAGGIWQPATGTEVLPMKQGFTGGVEFGVQLVDLYLSVLTLAAGAPGLFQEMV
jgi:hypothetical protein